MSATAEFDEVEAKEWNSLLLDFDDANIFQSWAYGAAHWGEKNLSHAVMREDGHVIGLAQSVLVGVPCVGKVLAYVIFGPLWQPRGAAREIGRFRAVIEALRQEYAQRRRLCLRLRPPCAGWADDLREIMAAENSWEETNVPLNTAIADLSRSEDALRLNMDRRWRSNLRKAEQQDLIITQEIGARATRIFVEIHEQMESRKRFQSDFIRFFPTLYERLPEALKPEVFICWHDDKPVASAIVSAVGDCAIYLNGGTAGAALEVRAGYFLQWAILRWLKEKTLCRWYDLNGLMSSPGVRQFKKGLVGPTAPEITMREFDACDSSWSAGIVRGGQQIRVVQRKFKKHLGWLRINRVTMTEKYADLAPGQLTHGRGGFGWRDVTFLSQ